MSLKNINNDSTSLQKILHTAVLDGFNNSAASIVSALKPSIAETLSSAAATGSMLCGLATSLLADSSLLTKSLLSMSDAYLDLVNSIAIPPVVEWFRSFDFSSVFTPLFELGLNDKEIQELNAIYLMAMYESKWFPYAGWIADETLFDSVDEISSTSRGISKRREKRIDKAIIAYYTDTKISAFQKDWKKQELDKCMRKSLSQAIDAYFRKEYVLTISCLATMWEGLIYIKAKQVMPEERERQRMKITKQEFADLTKANDYDKIFADYFENFIVSQCDKVDDVIEGVPNRHGTSHSWYKKYPNKKAALNAILLTDFILKLEPIIYTEENNCGQT